MTKESSPSRESAPKSLNKDPIHYSNLAVTYDLDSCIRWINNNNFEKVCLQFPESLLIDSVDITAYIENSICRKAYILGDTAYGRKIKKKKKVVLDEDTYLDRMGKIIERDFFPDLKKMTAQNDYLDAVEKNDTIKLREIYAKYTCEGRVEGVGGQSYSSPATFETPLDCRPSEDSVLKEEGRVQGNMDGNACEIEDAGSSSKTLTLDRYLAQHTSEDNQSFEDIMEETEARNRQKHPWLYKEERSNEEASNCPALGSNEEERPRQLDTWGYKNRNYIMYVPDGIQSDQTPSGQEITHSNTRFEGSPWDESQSKERIQGLAQQQVKVLDGKIGVDGKELVGSSPRIDGYNLVTTPSPLPGVNESPLMTWGEIEGTPFRLDAGDRTPGPYTGPSFRIPEPPRREKLAHALADKHSLDRQRKKKAMESARRHLSQSPCDRLGSMSPAARRLATTQLRKALGTTDKALLASYSPRHTPNPKLGSTPSHLTTDNLLNINISHSRNRPLT